MKYQAKDRVNVIKLGTGCIVKAFQDARGEDLYTVRLDDATLTPDGWMLTRECELEPIK